MKFYANIFIALIVCTMVSILAPAAEREAFSMEETEGISAEASVGNMVLSSIRHRDAAVSGPCSSRSADNFSRAKGGKTQSPQAQSTAGKERRTICVTGKPIIYKSHGNLSISAPRSADRYVYALERIII